MVHEQRPRIEHGGLPSGYRGSGVVQLSSIATVPLVNDVDIVEILDLDRLLVLMVLAIGFAMLAGNSFAAWHHHKGNKPKGEEGEFRPARAYWLIAVGLIMTIWGTVSLVG